MDDFGDLFKTRYDARLVGAVVRFDAGEHAASGIDVLLPRYGWEPTPSQRDQLVRLDQGSLHILLGKNGSGKSRLLDSLRRCRTDECGYPAASLLFELPSRELHDEWQTEIQNAMRGAMDDCSGNEATPPVLGATLGALISGGAPDYIETLKWRGSDLFEFFGATDDEMRDWNALRRRNDGMYGLDSQSGPRSWLPAKYPLEYLMFGAQRLKINLTSASDDHFGKDVYAGGQWFDIPESNDLVLPAVREFLESVTHIEFISDSIGVRFIAPDTTSGALGEFLNRKTEDLDDRGVGEHPFPAGLFSRIDVGGFPRIASLEMQLWEGRDDWFRLVDIDPSTDVDQKIVELVAELFSKLTTVRTQESGDQFEVSYQGLSALSALITSVAQHVRRCQIGVQDLMLTWTAPHPELRWKDGNSDEWFPVSFGSEGQKHVIALFLQLALLQGGSGLSLIVGDEFDRHLHPTASTSVLEQLRELVEAIPRVCAIVSTHNIPALSKPSLLSVQRIYSKREHSIFEYESSMDASEELTAEVLGSDFLDILRLKRLFILVEGEHDEEVIRWLLDQQPIGMRDIHLVNSGGPTGWSGTFKNALRFVDAPILVVYDKQNLQLEEEWEKVRLDSLREGDRRRWGGELRKLLDDVERRKRDGSWWTGDTELKSLLEFLKYSVFPWRNGSYECDSRQASRVHLCGLYCEDIVDLLPTERFPRAKSFNTWSQAHGQFRKEYPRGDGKAFKARFGINTRTIKDALNSANDSIHPELTRLYDLIVTLVRPPSSQDPRQSPGFGKI